MHDPRIELVELAMADIAVHTKEPDMELLARIAISVIDAFEAGYSQASKDDEADDDYCSVCGERHDAVRVVRPLNLEDLFGPEPNRGDQE